MASSLVRDTLVMSGGFGVGTSSPAELEASGAVEVRWPGEYSLSPSRNGEGDAETGRRFSRPDRLIDAVEALGLSVQQGSYVSRASFYRVLKRCIAQKDLALGRRVHALSVQGGYESDAFRANHLIRMYASHGRLEDAAQVFSRVSAPDCYVWSSIISAHAEHGQPGRAVDLFRQMLQSPGLQPNSYVFVAALKACGLGKDLVSGREVHERFLQQTGVEQDDVFVGNSLVDMYAKCGSLEDARRVFDGLRTRDVVTWTTMMAGYTQHGLGEEALALYESMKQDKMNPANRVTFLCVLQACASVAALDRGKEIHAQIRQRGLDTDVVVGSCLVDMYAKCGGVEDARRVFDSLPTKDVVTWTTMIAGYVQHGRGQEALALYASMQQEGLTPANLVTYVCLLRACASVGALKAGQQLHAQVREQGMETDVVVGSCLVDMYAKCGNLAEARRVFDRLPKRDVVTWTAMIAGYAQCGQGGEALALYGSMQQEGLAPADQVTFVRLLPVCASLGALHQGKQLHAEIEEIGLETDVVVGSSLVDMYAKCGSLEDSRRVFDKLASRNVVVWNAMLNGYAQNCDFQTAVQCFEEMQQQGVEPNEVTFICLLVACSQEGLVQDGQRYFRMMVEDYGIVPNDKHYSSLVDLLGRSGRLDEAEDVLHTMPFQNDVVGWTSLLSSCKSRGDIERGRRCFDCLVASEPEDASAYVLMGNIYANAGRWWDVIEVQRLRKSAGAWKKPAKACIEVNDKVLEFVVGEEKGDVSSKLRSMQTRLKEEGGHVPQTELVLKEVPQVEKEDALCGHAEKLALAYGLLHTPDGTTLLITKNLRMCNDCHSSTKIMSSLEKREIFVRDAHRVHRFQDGACSCGDRQ